jgi:glycosyltransferase involved in cell wall biosynthesis
MLSTNSKKVLLSVVVPVTRMAGRLSLMELWLSKTHQQPFVEVIIIHDKQDEETSLELKEVLGRLDSGRVRLIENSVNSPGLARNLGLEAARGEWVIFVDSDDEFLIENLLCDSEVFKNSRLDALVYNFEKVFPRDNYCQIIRHNSNELRIGWTPGIWRWIFRRDAIRAITFSKHSMGEDQFFLLKFLGLSPTLSFRNDVIYRYHTGSSGQLTGNKKAIQQIHPLLSEVSKTRSLEGYEYSLLTEVIYLHLILSSINHARGFKKISKVLFLLVELIGIRKSHIRITRILLARRLEVE